MILYALWVHLLLTCSTDSECEGTGYELAR